MDDKSTISDLEAGIELTKTQAQIKQLFQYRSAIAKQLNLLDLELAELRKREEELLKIITPVSIISSPKRSHKKPSTLIPEDEFTTLLAEIRNKKSFNKED